MLSQIEGTLGTSGIYVAYLGILGGEGGGGSPFQDSIREISSPNIKTTHPTKKKRVNIHHCGHIVVHWEYLTSAGVFNVRGGE